MTTPERRVGEPTRRRPPEARATSAARQDMSQLSQLELQHYSESYSGPVPPPAMLEQYDRLVPGSAKQIIDTAMGQTAHRQAQESKVISGSEVRANRGQLLGALVLLAGILCGLVIALEANAVVGGGVIGGVVASGALVYLVGGRPPKEEPPPPELEE